MVEIHNNNNNENMHIKYHFHVTSLCYMDMCSYLHFMAWRVRGNNCVENIKYLKGDCIFSGYTI